MSQHYATHHEPTGLGNCMTVMWLTCHPFLMGHSCGQLVFDWLGSYSPCSPPIASTQEVISVQNEVRPSPKLCCHYRNPALSPGH